MMRTFSKMLAMLLVLVMLFSIAGCGDKDTNPAAGSTVGTSGDSTAQPTADEPAWKSNKDDSRELTWYLNLSWFTAQWGKDWTSEYIKEKTGFNIVASAPAGNETEKLNTMIASGSMPDIITLGWWEPQIAELIASDMVYPLNKLADQYDPYFNKAAKQDILNWNRQEDGNVYGYNCFTTTKSDIENGDAYANRTFLVRKDMYEALGKPNMTTPDGFYNALKAAKEKFPTVDGNPLSPLGAMQFNEVGSPSFEDFLADHLAIPYEKDGKLYDRKTDPEYITWLKMFNRAYRDGLISKDIFVDKTEIGDKIAQGRYFSMFFQWIDMQGQQKIRFDTDPDSIYIAVDGPRNSKGDNPTLPAGSVNGWLLSMITKNCEEPDRAIEFFTYMISEEGMKDVTCGVPGKTYNDENGKVVYTQEYLDLLNNNPNNIQHGVNEWGYFQDDAMMADWLVPPADYITIMRDWTKPYVFYGAPYDLPSLDPDSKESMNSSKIDTLWGKALPTLLTAPSEAEFDKILNKFIADRESMGFEAVMAAKTELMNQNKEKLK